jgi:2-octaprenyl-6-methoxyphenol hydroxylase
MAVDLLNRSLLADYIPVDFARGAGLMAIANFKPLRQFIMRRGAGF